MIQEQPTISLTLNWEARMQALTKLKALTPLQITRLLSLCQFITLVLLIQITKNHLLIVNNKH